MSCFLPAALLHLEALLQLGRCVTGPCGKDSFGHEIVLPKVPVLETDGLTLDFLRPARPVLR